MTKLDIKPSTYYCHDCEVDLNDENTMAHGGFDGGNYLASRTYGDTDPSIFIKCDSCFDADIDRALETMYE